MTGKRVGIMTGSIGLLLVAMSGVARADHYVTLDRLARGIEQKAIYLRREAMHFCGAPGYSHFIRDVNEVRRLAGQVRREVHRGRNLSHLQRDVRSLARSIDHLEGVVHRMRHHVYPGSHYDYDLSRLHATIEWLEDCVRDMDAAIDALCSITPVPVPVPVPVVHPHPVPSFPYYPTTPHHRWYGPQYGHGGGITIQRGRFRISFGF